VLKRKKLRKIRLEAYLLLKEHLSEVLAPAQHSIMQFLECRAHAADTDRKVEITAVLAKRETKAENSLFNRFIA
jgi:hypothetical protein